MSSSYLRVKGSASLLASHYMGLSGEEAVQQLDLLRQRCQLFSGDFTFLWHNHVVADPVWRSVFESVLRKGQQAV